MQHKLMGLMFGLILLTSTGCIYNTGPNEVGVRTRKLSLTNRGVDPKFYPSGRTYFFLPLINDWHTFDTKLQNIEMTYDATTGEVPRRDDLNFKTIDGNDISLDVIIAYRIVPEKAPHILQNVAASDDDLRMLVRVLARSLPRDVFGELKTEDFYQADDRSSKSERAMTALNDVLNPLGVVVERLLTKDYRFNDKYQQAIEDKKVADQRTEQLKSSQKAKAEEYRRRLEEAKGDVYRMRIKAHAEYDRSKIKADAYYDRQAQIARAIREEGRAEAKGIQKMKSALAEQGGTVMVKLKIAEALQGKRIFLLPSGTGNGLQLNTMDMNDFLKIQGLSKMAPKTTPKRSK